MRALLRPCSVLFVLFCMGAQSHYPSDDWHSNNPHFCFSCLAKRTSPDDPNAGCHLLIRPGEQQGDVSGESACRHIVTESLPNNNPGFTETCWEEADQWVSSEAFLLKRLYDTELVAGFIAQFSDIVSFQNQWIKNPDIKINFICRMGDLKEKHPCIYYQILKEVYTGICSFENNNDTDAGRVNVEQVADTYVKKMAMVFVLAISPGLTSPEAHFIDNISSAHWEKLPQSAKEASLHSDFMNAIARQTYRSNPLHSLKKPPPIENALSSVLAVFNNKQRQAPTQKSISEQLTKVADSFGAIHAEQAKQRQAQAQKSISEQLTKVADSFGTKQGKPTHPVTTRTTDGERSGVHSLSEDERRTKKAQVVQNILQFFWLTNLHQKNNERNLPLVAGGLAVDALAQAVEWGYGDIALSQLMQKPANNALLLVESKEGFEQWAAKITSASSSLKGIDVFEHRSDYEYRIDYSYKGCRVFYVAVQLAQNVGFLFTPKHDRLRVVLDQNTKSPDFYCRFCSYETLLYIAGQQLADERGWERANYTLNPPFSPYCYFGQVPFQSITGWWTYLHNQMILWGNAGKALVLEAHESDLSASGNGFQVTDTRATNQDEPEQQRQAVGTGGKDPEVFLAKLRLLKKKADHLALDDMMNNLRLWYPHKAPKNPVKLQAKGKKTFDEQIAGAMASLSASVERYVDKHHGFPDGLFIGDTDDTWKSVKYFKSKGNKIKLREYAVPYMGKHPVEVTVIDNAENRHFNLERLVQHVLRMDVFHENMSKQPVKQEQDQYMAFLGDLLLKWHHYNRLLNKQDAFNTVMANCADFITLSCHQFTAPAHTIKSIRVPDLAFAFIAILKESTADLSTPTKTAVHKAIASLFHYSSLNQELALSCAIIDYLASDQQLAPMLDDDLSQTLHADTLNLVASLALLMNSWDGDNRAYVELSHTLTHEVSPVLQQFEALFPAMAEDERFQQVKERLTHLANTILHAHKKAADQLAADEEIAAKELEAQYRAEEDRYVKGLQSLAPPEHNSAITTEQQPVENDQDSGSDNETIGQAPCLWVDEIKSIRKIIVDGALNGQPPQGNGASKKKRKKLRRPEAQKVAQFIQRHEGDHFAMASLYADMGRAYFKCGRLPGKVRALSNAINKAYQQLLDFEEQLERQEISQLPRQSVVTLNEMIVWAQSYPGENELEKILSDWQEGDRCYQRANDALNNYLAVVPAEHREVCEALFIQRFREDRTRIKRCIDQLIDSKNQLDAIFPLRGKVLRLSQPYRHKVKQKNGYASASLSTQFTELRQRLADPSKVFDGDIFQWLEEEEEKSQN